MEKKNYSFEDRKKVITRHTSLVDNHVLTTEIKSWQNFAGCLRINNHKLFEQMLQC